MEANNENKEFIKAITASIIDIKYYDEDENFKRCLFYNTINYAFSIMDTINETGLIELMENLLKKSEGYLLMKFTDIDLKLQAEREEAELRAHIFEELERINVHLDYYGSIDCKEKLELEEKERINKILNVKKKKKNTKKKKN